MRTPENVLKIGVLNLMHDKLDTRRRFERVLKNSAQPVELTFFYPKDHYQDRPVPAQVAQIARPLELAEVEKLDAFIVTGAPIEKLDFAEITYINELQELFNCLAQNKIEQLYVCWGAMAAVNYFYGVDKYLLSQKLFGIYPQEVLRDSKLLAQVAPGFLAPHARYADIDLTQAKQVPELEITAVSQNGEAFLLEAPTRHQTFLFSHLEYGRDALQKEYARELAADPSAKDSLARPKNYYVDGRPQFLWETLQKQFFANWLHQVARTRKAKELIKN